MRDAHSTFANPAAAAPPDPTKRDIKRALHDKMTLVGGFKDTEGKRYDFPDGVAVPDSFLAQFHLEHFDPD
jgi:hypothetical protein